MWALYLLFQSPNFLAVRCPHCNRFISQINPFCLMLLWSRCFIRATEINQYRGWYQEYWSHFYSCDKTPFPRKFTEESIWVYGSRGLVFKMVEQSQGGRSRRPAQFHAKSEEPILIFCHRHDYICRFPQDKSGITNPKGPGSVFWS